MLKTETNVFDSISSNTFEVQSKSQNQEQPYQYLHYAQQQDGQYLNHQNYQMLTQLSEILEEQGEIGEFELDVFTVKVKNLHTYEKELILVK